MNTLVYVEPGAEAQLLLRALERLDLTSVEHVARWDELLSRVAAARPDVAIVSYASMAEVGGHRLETAALTLKAIGVPVVVSLDATYSAVLADIAVQTGFAHFIATPFERNDVATALGEATGRESFERRSTDVTSDFAAVVDVEAPLPLSNAPRANEHETAQHDLNPYQLEAMASADSATSLSGSGAAVAPPFSGDVSALSASGAAIAPPFSGESAALSGSGAAIAPPFEPSYSSGASPYVSDQAIDAAAAAASAAPDPFFSGNRPAAANPAEALAALGVDEAQAGATIEVVQLDDPFRGEPEDAFDDEPAPPSFADSLGSGSVPASGAFRPSGRGRGVEETPSPASSGSYRKIRSGASERVGSGSAPSTPTAGIASPSAATAPAADDAAPPVSEDGVRTVALPPDSGSVADHDVATLMHGLHVRRSTGELLLRNATLTRRVVVFDGEFGTVFQAPSADDERKLLSTFGWREGTFEFTERDVPEAQFHSFGAPLELIFRGVERHVGINELAVALGAELKRYPRRTDQVDRVARVLGLEDVQSFADASEGAETLEQMLARAGAATEEMLRNAFFGRIAGVIVFDAAPGTGVVPVAFDAPQDSSGARPRIRATAPAAAANVVPASVRTSVSADAAQSGAQHRETYDRLGKLWNTISSQDGYETFSLKPGCGAEAVNRRFYEMVREYHPDRYARIQNQQIKTLAEKIFLHVRNLHTELVQREQTGDFRRSTGDFQNRASGVSVPGASSGPQRRVTNNTPPPVTSAQPSARPSADALADSGLSSRERRTRRRSTGSRLTSSTSGPHSAARPTSRRRPATPRAEAGEGSNYGATGQSKNVGEALNRLRSRAESDSHNTGGFSRASSGSYQTISSSRRMAPDQLLRNAKKAIANGAEEKAHDLVVLAKQKGAKGAEVDGLESYLRARIGETDSETASLELDKLFEGAESKIVKSQLKLLQGHLHRLDENYREAHKAYAASFKEDTDNGEAERWLRFARKRATEAPAKKKAEDDEPKSFFEKLKSIEIKFGKK